MPKKPIFFYKEKDDVIVCDALRQRYFSLEKKYIERLFFKDSEHPADPSVEQDLLEAGILDPESTLKQPEKWLGDRISSIAHYGSRITSSEQPILSPEALFAEYADLSCNADVPERCIPESTRFLSLPLPNLEALQNFGLWESFLKRKTSRNFFRTPVSIEFLSTILYSCFAPIHGNTWNDFSENNITCLGQRRSSPSAAGMQGCDAYVIIREFSGIDPGVYFYNPDKHVLHLINAEPSDEDIRIMMGDQFWAQDIPIGIFLVHDMRKTWVKDHKNRGYLAAYLEAGHISQNIQLAAKAFDLDTWITGTFRDDKIDDLLCLETIPSFATFFVGLGYGTNESLPEKFVELSRK